LIYIFLGVFLYFVVTGILIAYMEDSHSDLGFTLFISFLWPICFPFVVGEFIYNKLFKRGA